MNELIYIPNINSYCLSFLDSSKLLELNKISKKIYDITRKCNSCSISNIEDFILLKKYFPNTKHVKIDNIKNKKDLELFEDLESLDFFFYIGTEKIEDIIFKNMPNLKYLDLSTCDAIQFNNNSLKYLKNLLSLTLINCEYELTDDFFNNLVNLQYLDISHNRKLQITNNCFSNCRNLQILKMYGSICNVTDNFSINLKNIKHLELSQYNKFSDKFFENLNNLIILDMSFFNGFITIKIFQNMKNIEYLTVAWSIIETELKNNLIELKKYMPKLKKIKGSFFNLNTLLD